MKPVQSIGLAVVLLLGCVVGAALANQTYMEITFDDKAIDQPIGEGGMTVGEPDFVDSRIEAIVRSSPFATPSLEIHSTVSTGNPTIWFNYAGSGITSGLVVIIMDLWLYGSGPGWESYWTIYTPNFQNLMEFRFLSDGRIHIDGAGTDAYVPSYPIGRSFPVLIALDMDTDTFSVWMDETQYVENQPLRLEDREFGAIWFAAGASIADENRVFIDQIRVIDWMSEVPIVETTWGRVRALYR